MRGHDDEARGDTMILPADILPALFFYLFAGICVASAFMVIASPRRTRCTRCSS